MERIKSIVVTPHEQLHTFFQEELASEFDFQHQVHSIGQLANDLESGRIDDTSKVIIFDDNLIENNDVHEMSTAIALYAPYALVFLLSYREEFPVLIHERVEREMSMPDSIRAPFFIMSSEQAMDDFDEVVEYNRGFLVGQVDLPQPVKKTSGNPALVSEEEYEEMTQDEEEEDTGGRKGYVICSTSSKGGSGKSTVALTLATTIAQASHKAYKEKLTTPGEEPLKVCVVDMDIFDGQLGMYIGQLQPTALNIRVSGAPTPENIAKNLVYDESMMIHALLAPKRGKTANDLPPEFYRQVIKTLKTMFDIVILDTSVQYLDPLISEVCLPMSDAILFISSLSVGSVYGMTRWLDEVTRPVPQGGMGINPGRIGIVLNQVVDNVGMDKTTLTEAAVGTRIISMIPLASQIVMAASNYNRLQKLPENEIVGPAYGKLAETIIKGISTEDRPLTLAPLIDEKSREVRQRNEQRKATGKQLNTAPPKKKGLFGFGR